MENTYTSRQARRKAAIADALMQSALSPSQGQMVGRYYVGEGLGGGITRLGQALLGRSLSGKADMLEDEALAEQKKAKQDAFDQFSGAVTPHDVTTMEYPGSGPMFGATPKTSKYTPTNQDIAAALMRYQSETGEKVDDSVVKMLAGGSLDGKPEAFGTRDFTLSDRPGYVWAVGYDKANNQKVMKDVYIPEKLATVNQGNQFGFAGQYSGPRNDVKPIPVNVSPNTAYEVASAPEKAAAVAKAQAIANREQGQIDKAVTAENGVELLDRYIAAVSKQPRTAAGRGIETALGVVGAGNEGEQNAMADAENLGAAIVTYAQKQPGPSSDRDVQNYLTQVGILSSSLVTQAQRLSAAKSAKESYLRVVQKYGDNWQPNAPSAPAGRPPLSSLIPIGGK